MEHKCTCGIDHDDIDIPPGQVMSIFIDASNRGFQAQILWFDFSLSDTPEPEVLYVTPWVSTEAKANRDARYRYWPLYEFKHGFKHPQDPRRTSSDHPPSATVITMGDTA